MSERVEQIKGAFREVGRVATVVGREIGRTIAAPITLPLSATDRSVRRFMLAGEGATLLVGGGAFTIINGPITAGLWAGAVYLTWGVIGNGFNRLNAHQENRPTNGNHNGNAAASA